ncbi:hypothetical protein [Lysinibacillus sp. BW-2-10]|uniref:hypothetical protein n=1 Tax=Lysinibacillus sp. BW-2-10 TaxID=2590030 RepID=UPI00117F400D|nr:hypothetical protein [Lysinibacillus sp. BW-2-10]TSI05764.1 hypothetical protein FJQ64_11775 [Lysinibacillus sp. BW-2-10]
MIALIKYWGVRKITSLFFVALFLYLVCTPILKGFYSIVQEMNSYFTFSTPHITATKYIILLLFILIFLYKKLELNHFGRAFFPVAITIFILFGVFTILYYNTTDEKEIVSQRLLIRHTYGWEDVEHIKVYAQNYKKINLFGKEEKVYSRTQRANGTRYIPYYEYRIYFKDGRSVNAWDDLDSLYRLDQFVKEIRIPIEYDVNESLRTSDNEEDKGKENAILGLHQLQ